MKINQKHFYEFNFQDFVHVKYLKHVMKDVARISADNIPDHKTIESLDFKTDKYGEQELHVTYLDYDNQEHDVLMKPAITDRVNELIDKRFRWIESGDDPIKKLEIKNHYFRITTDSTVADFEVPYIFNNGIEQDQLHVNNEDENYIKIKLVARNTHDEITLEVPTRNNFDELKADYEKFKEAFYLWQTEVNNHLTEIDKKNNEQDKRLTDVEQKNTEQDERLTNVEQKNTEQDGRLTDVEQKNTEQDGRLTNVEQKNNEQDNEINGIKDHQTSMDRIIEILQQKSHDFLQQLKNPADFNEIKEDGNYFVYADDTPDNHLTGANRPSDHWGILYNYKHEPSNQVQIYAADTDNILYMRTLNASGWTEWQEVATNTGLQEAITNLTKSLFVMYYDGKEADTTTANKPVANKALLLGEKGKLKGLTLFDEKDGKVDQLLIDTLSLPRVVDAKNKPEEKENALKMFNELKTGELVIIDYMTLVDHLNNLTNDEYSAVASLNRDVIFVKNERSLVSLETFSYLKYDYNLVLNTFNLQMLQRTDDYVFTTNSINSSGFHLNINNQQITVGNKNINVPQINTPIGNVENLLINNTTKYVDQSKVTTALNNLGLDPSDVLNISQEKDQEKVYNNSNLIIKLDEVNSKLNGNKRIYYLQDPGDNPQTKQAIMELPNIMNDGDIVYIEFFTVYDHLDPSINDNVHSVIQVESKPFLFIKTTAGVITNNNWYYLETSKYENKNYLELVSFNLKLNVTKDNYNFSQYISSRNSIALP